MNNLATDVAVLNPQLFNALTKAFGAVDVVHQGEIRKVMYLPDHSRRGRLKAKPLSYGEQYEINCPFCDDQRHRCRVNHQLGKRDPKTQSANWHLFYCFNEKCHEDSDNWKILRRRLVGAGYHAGRVTRTPHGEQHVATGRSRPAAQLPKGLVPLHLLPCSHPAAEYVIERGFDPVELSIRWGVCYCERNQDVDAHFDDPRVVIPIYRLRPDLADKSRHELKLAGWQARTIDNSRRIGKYLFMKDTPKGDVLYGLAEALAVPGPVIVCEGVTDCWSIGPGAVAVFGKTLSSRQGTLLKRHFLDRPIVILLDNEAQEEARDIQRRLRGSFRSQVVVAQVPTGYEDPGDCPRRKLVECVAQALGCEPQDLARRHRFAIIDGNRRKFNERGRQKLGTSLCVSYAEGDTAGMALVGDDQRLRYVPAGCNSILRSVANHRRIYFDAVAGQMVENKAGLPVPQAFEDLKIVGRLLDENRPADLESVANLLLPANVSAEDLPAMTGHPPATQALGVAQLVRRVWDEANPLDRLAANELTFIYEQIEKPVVGPTVAMMQRGIRVDVEALKRRIKRYRRDQHALLKHAERLLQHADAGAGRVHCQLHPLGAVTGRYTCDSPALQCLHRKLREMLIPDEGHVFIEADFSQIELRVLAQLTRDRRLLRAYEANRDLHRQTAALLLGMDPEAVTGERRKIGKKVNFAIIYGQTAAGLAKELHIPRHEADDLLDDFRTKHPGFARWEARIHKKVRDDCFVATLYGRRRHFDEDAFSDDAKTARSLRQAVNAVVQGTAADINKLAIARLSQNLPKEWEQLLTVHDSVLLQVPKKDAQEAIVAVQRLMETPPPKFDVPIVVDVAQGKSWAACRGR